MMKIEVTVRDLKKVIISFIIATLIFMNVVIVANEPKNNEVKKINAKASETVETELTFDQKIGMNGFVDCKFDNLKAGGILREYHNFGWTYDANSGKCYFQSSWFDFDDFYKRVSEAGIEILPCIQQGNNKENREYKPVEE